nr:hypothetical protein OH820_15905 [Streptomyces sp. NBC_00857]
MAAPSTIDPFWTALLTGLLTVTGTLVGTVIGSRFSRRSAEEQWAREQRQQVEQQRQDLFWDLLTAADEVKRLIPVVWSRWSRRARHTDHAEWNAAVKTIHSLVSRAQLLEPATLRAAASTLLQRLREVTDTMRQQGLRLEVHTQYDEARASYEQSIEDLRSQLRDLV